MRSAHWLHRLTELGPALVKHAFAPLMRFGTARTVGDPSAPRTLFVHIPRTAGDAIQTAVFAHLPWERSDIHSPIQCLDEAEMKALRQHRVAKGFVSRIEPPRGRRSDPASDSACPAWTESLVAAMSE